MSDAPTELFKKDGLGHKLGPLPVWAWAAILGVGVLIYMRFSSSGSTAGAPTTGTTDQAGYPSYSDTGTEGEDYDTSSFSSTPTGYTDNSSWEAAAIGEASTFGSNPLDVQQAVDTGLNGGTFTSSGQQSLWNEIVTALGAPPTGTLGTPGSYVAPSTTSTAAATNTSNPWGTSSVFAVGSTAGTQYILQNGKAVALSSAAVTAARKAGYDYKTVVVPNVKDIP